jgi:hypothetical protein
MFVVSGLEELPRSDQGVPDRGSSGCALPTSENSQKAKFAEFLF